MSRSSHEQDTGTCTQQSEANAAHARSTGDPASRRAAVDALLDDRSYHIEFRHIDFNGYLSNHAKQAVVALDRLGASVERIRTYYATYARQTYGYGLEAARPSVHVITQDNWEHYLGMRTSYSAYCRFFDQQERSLGMDAVLRRYLPTLVAGWVGALAHGAIHLGWALDAGHRWMTIEGLAYLAFSYVSCHPESHFPVSHGSAEGESAVDSLLAIADAWVVEGDALRGWLERVLAGADDGIHPELVKSGSQYKIAKVMADGHALIHAIPGWIDAQDASAVWEQLHYAVALVYLTRPGDFTVLHLITALHGMEQIAVRMPVGQHRHAAKCFWSGMLGILFSRGEFPGRAALEALHTRYRTAVDHDENAVVGALWKQIVASAIAEEEEHNPKLVYVERLAWRRFGNRSIFRIAAGHFTTTPKLPSYQAPATRQV